MARILEALQQTHTGVRPTVIPMVDAPSRRTSKEVTVPVEATEEIPYIEVGGPKVEASPSVLQSGTVQKSEPARAAEILPLPRKDPPADRQIESKTSAVVFRPLPGIASPASPKERFAPELIAYHEPEHALSRQYHALLAEMTRSFTTEPRLLLLSGVTGGAGTTTVVLNLAISRARQGNQQVAVVDADLRHPTVAMRLGLPSEPGLCDVLAGAIPLHRALRITGQPNLTALTAGGIANSPFLPVRSLKETLHQMRKCFDLVFIDAPPWREGIEMPALASTCDAVFLVLSQEKAESQEVQELSRTILRQGVPLRGSVLTGCRL